MNNIKSIDTEANNIFINGTASIIGRYEVISSLPNAKVSVDIKITSELPEEEKVNLCQLLLAHFSGQGIRVEFPKMTPVC